MNPTQITYIIQSTSRCQKRDESKTFDIATLVLIGTGSSSLLVAFAEYIFSRKRKEKTKA
jgi:hypothetical protein